MAITERDFERAATTPTLEKRIGLTMPKKLSSKAAFELAKRMAIDLVSWANQNMYSQINIAKEGDVKGIWRWWWYGEIAPPSDKNTYTTEQLFELYQQQKQ
jgi:hypothetical protein